MRNKYKLNLSKYSTHNIIRNMIGENNIVLDVGCNDGYIGEVSHKSNKFYGLDNNKEVLKEAKKHNVGVSYYDLNTFSKIPWNIKFDVIIFADVLEHVMFPEQVLIYFVKNYLKKEGRVIISIPNIANWQIRLKLLIGKFEYTEAGILDKTHLHFYTYKTAKELVINNELKVDYIDAGSSLFGYVIKILPITKKLLTTSIILQARRK